jgi:hypothetical protein
MLKAPQCSVMPCLHANHKVSNAQQAVTNWRQGIRCRTTRPGIKASEQAK